MLSIAHTLISLPFGIYLENPIIIFLSTFILHLLADTLLHWNVYPERWGKLFYPLAVLDVTGGVLIAWLLLGNQFFTWPILLAIAGGNMPDVLHTLWEMTTKKFKKSVPGWIRTAFAFHDALQLETKKPLPGLIWQIILVTIAIITI